jgi:hypothetical protein
LANRRSMRPDVQTALEMSTVWHTCPHSSPFHLWGHCDTRQRHLQVRRYKTLHRSRQITSKSELWNVERYFQHFSYYVTISETENAKWVPLLSRAKSSEGECVRGLKHSFNLKTIHPHPHPEYSLTDSPQDGRRTLTLYHWLYTTLSPRRRKPYNWKFLASLSTLNHPSTLLVLFLF